MNSKTWTRIAALTLFAALALPVRLTAQETANPNHAHQHHHYQLVDIGTFGGPDSSYAEPPPSPGGRLLNSSGTAVGSGDTPTADPYCVSFNFDCYVGYGFKWQDGVANALSPLSGFNGLNSATALWVSDSGLAAGLSENGLDPLTGGPATEAVLWGTDNSLTDLGTLGGNQSFAWSVNNRGQVAGAALNTIPDSNAGFFFLPGATQVHAFRWTKSHGMQDLGTLGGTDSAAFSINERGQIAGMSFTNTIPNPVWDICGGFAVNVPTEDPFLWENGKMIDLGTLGGTCGQAMALNNRDHVIGISNLAGDSIWHAFLWRNQSEGMKDLGSLGGDSGTAFSINDADDVVGIDTTADNLERAFLWRHGVMTNLGTIGTDPGSEAYSINSQGQVVGDTRDPSTDTFLRAFLWEDGGPMVDLNNLVPPNSGVQLVKGLYVNERGEIAVRGVLSNGDLHSVLLIPCDENHPGVEGCDYSLVDAATASTQSAARPSLSSTTQNLAHSRWSNRYHMRGLPLASK